MKPKKLHVLLLWILASSGVTEALEPISTTLVVGAATVLTGFLTNYFSKEGCRSQWISFNRAGLQLDLESKLFGQHIASRIIFKAVNGFMSNENPKKPLVLSLHGWTGTGKTYVSKMIAESIYKEGMDSKFVHFFISTLHFPHRHYIAIYKAQLQQWIRGNVSNCERSMFIFDEMDKMHPGLIDGIEPYLDYNDNVDGISFRKSIFIFLSNAGDESIVQTALDFWKAGHDREEIELEDLETALSVSVFNNKNSGFFRTSLIDRNVVDIFVPFLPLQYEHVVQCAMAGMKARKRRPDLDKAKMVARDLVYFPKSERVFSVVGCKTIESKLDYNT